MDPGASGALPDYEFALSRRIPEWLGFWITLGEGYFSPLVFHNVLFTLALGLA